MTAPGAPVDLLVLGGGTAGIVAAKTAVSLGASTLLVERERTGGDCLWTGCVPSKALLAAAHQAAAARTADRFGLEVTLRVDFARVMDRVQQAIAEIAPIDSPETLRAAGVPVRHGQGVFRGEGEVAVDGVPVRYRQAVLAMGSAPTIPPLPGLAEVDYLTSDSFWSLREAPRRLAVLGAGSIGCELGQAMARLGSEVTLVENAERILPREDPAAAAAVARSLRCDGVRVQTGARVAAVHAAPAEGAGAGRLQFEDGREIAFDRLLVAVGRTPRTSGAGLERIGVACDDRGHIRVDGHLRTTNPRIWAAGDLTGHPQFTHVAASHGSLAASNAVLGVRRRAETTVPRVTYTHPEVAALGAATDGSDLRVVTREHTDVDRAVTEGETDGFTRLAVDSSGRVRGATIVGPRAGETLGEAALAVARGMRTRDLAGLMHPYPTWNDGLGGAAIADARTQLDAPLARRAVRLIVGSRRRWLDRRAT